MLWTGWKIVSSSQFKPVTQRWVQSLLIIIALKASSKMLKNLEENTCLNVGCLLETLSCSPGMPFSLYLFYS
jgi:hypothetical protein